MVLSMKQTFRDCKNFNGILNNWDVSNIRDMSRPVSWCRNF
ncbi:BspA family leucine-rich repeat surface protein [Maribacter litopenaei]